MCLLADEVNGVPRFDGYKNKDTALKMIEARAYVKKGDLQERFEGWYGKCFS